MKPLVILLALSIVPWTPLRAQIYEQIKSMSQGANTALVLEVPNADAKLVNEVWKDYMKGFYNAKPKWGRKAKEWFSDNVKIAAVGRGNSVDIFATAEEKGSTILFNVWFDLGGAFLNSREHTEQYTEAEKMLMRFALEVAQEQTRRELDGETDELKKLQREMGRLQSLNERYHSEIERAEAIKKAQQDIVDNEKLQEDMLQQIAEQEKAIEEVKKRLNDL